MFRKILFLIVSICVLSSCSDGFKNYFKKSANNKLIDSQGFKGGKRKPLYNKKYLTLAKRNVAESNFDDDDDIDLDEELEFQSPQRLNRQMYMDMLKEDASKRKKRARSNRHFYEDDTGDDSYPSFPRTGKASTRAEYKETDNELKKEINELREMLLETKKELARYKCPTAESTISPRSPAKSSKNVEGGPSYSQSKPPAQTISEHQEPIKPRPKFLTEEDDFEPAVRTKSI